MSSAFWAKMHGGATHFPIALVMASTLFDMAGLVFPDNPGKTRRAGFHSAGFYTIVLGAFGAFGAVGSGLVLSQGQLFGHGNLGRHHVFLWPAFGLLISLAVWRLAVRDRGSARGFKIYLAGSMLTAVLMAAAGYWGGELLLNG
jgi:uncharacterized membrane protein